MQASYVIEHRSEGCKVQKISQTVILPLEGLAHIWIEKEGIAASVPQKERSK